MCQCLYKLGSLLSALRSLESMNILPLSILPSRRVRRGPCKGKSNTSLANLILRTCSECLSRHRGQQLSKGLRSGFSVTFSKRQQVWLRTNIVYAYTKLAQHYKNRWLDWSIPLQSAENGLMQPTIATPESPACKRRFKMHPRTCQRMTSVYMPR